MVNLTTEYKTQMLEWLTGNYQVEARADDLSFYETKEVDTGDFYQKIIDKLHELFGSGGSWSYLDAFRMLKGQNNANNGESFTLIFGGYDGHGYIMLLDENSDIEYVITEYSSGTPFKPIKAMGVAEDGTFFMVEETSTYPRFVLLNNILAKLPESQDYEAVLRKSYTFPSNYLANFSNVIIKAPGQSKYLISAWQISGSSSANVALELEINVGSSNNWTAYTAVAGSYGGYNNVFIVYTTYAEWDSNGDLSFKIAGVSEKGTTTEKYYTEYIGSSSNTAMTKTLSIRIYVSSLFGIPQPKTSIFIKNMNTTYVGLVEPQTTTDKISINYVDYDNSLLKPIYSSNVSDYQASFNSIWFYPIGNEVLLCLTQNLSGTGYINFGRIYNNNIYYEEVYTTDTPLMGWSAYFSASKQFNLYQYLMQIRTKLIKTKEVYNSNNYNGDAYQDYNSMIPNSCILLDDNDLIVFAKNLYDRLVQGNTTTSILQIPYNYANNIILKTQQLFGETNKKLIENVSQFTKNIYEEVMLSFMNTITMHNKNNINNVINNINGAIRVNQSTMLGSNLAYNNAKLVKCRINYADNTSKVINITNSINSLTATYDFLIYIDKLMNTIDLISNDEATVYCTINASNFEVNKYYKITQEVIIN